MTPRASRALARLLGTGLFAILKPLDPFLWLLLMRPRAYVAGFAITIDGDCAAPGSAIARLTDAVHLVDAVDPRRLARIRRDVRRLHVSSLGHAARYWHRPSAIVWRDEVLVQQPTLWVASTLVHEGTHARIRGAGIRSTHATRARVERRCVGEAAEFLRNVAARFPEHAALAESFIAHEERELSRPIPWYEPSQKWARAREALVAHDAPRWVLWLFDGFEPDRSPEAQDNGE